MARINFRRVFVVVGLTGLAITYVILWLQMIASQSERTGADFIGFYTAARIAQTEDARQIYIPQIQQKIEQQLVGFELIPGQVLLFNHLPYLLPLLTQLVNANYAASFIRWTSILLILVVFDTGLLLLALKHLDFDRYKLVVLAAGTISFYPMFTSLMNGQDTAFLLLGGAIWLSGCLFGKDEYAGIGLGLMTIRPQLALILALPFLFKRRKVFLWFIASAIALGSFTIFYLGLDGVRNFLQILAISARGEWYGLHPEAMPTLTGLLHRLVPGMDVGMVQIVGFGGYFLALVAICFLWSRSKQIGPTQIGLAVLAGIFFVPYLHYHDLSILLIPIYCLIRIATPPQRSFVVLLPLIISYLFLFGSFWSPTTYITVFSVMIGLSYFLINSFQLKGVDCMTSSASTGSISKDGGFFQN